MPPQGRRDDMGGRGMNLPALKQQADDMGQAFDDACRPHFADGRWGAYRAIECGQPVPKSVSASLDAYTDATHAYYLARDGAGGFLGGR